MNISEIAVMLLVYSGLMIYFLVPFRSELTVMNSKQNQLNTKTIIMVSLIKLLFQRKAIVALILFLFSILSIWVGFAQAEYHYNAHSGYPPISNDSKAIYSIGGLLIYSIIIYFLLVLMKSFKVLKNVRKY